MFLPIFKQWIFKQSRILIQFILKLFASCLTGERRGTKILVIEHHWNLNICRDFMLWPHLPHSRFPPSISHSLTPPQLEISFSPRFSIEFLRFPLPSIMGLGLPYHSKHFQTIECSNYNTSLGPDSGKEDKRRESGMACRAWQEAVSKKAACSFFFFLFSGGRKCSLPPICIALTSSRNLTLGVKFTVDCLIIAGMLELLIVEISRRYGLLILRYEGLKGVKKDLKNEYFFDFAQLVFSVSKITVGVFFARCSLAKKSAYLLSSYDTR